MTDQQICDAAWFAGWLALAGGFVIGSSEFIGIGMGSMLGAVWPFETDTLHIE